MSRRPNVSADVLASLRGVCTKLPETYEEEAWVGTRWRIRKQTFAHVLMIDAGWPPAYAKAAGSAGPLCVLTFRSKVAELNAHSYASDPFFRPRWWNDIVGMMLNERTDWNEVAYLIAESYRTMAPKKLADLMEAPLKAPTRRTSTTRRR